LDGFAPRPQVRCYSPTEFRAGRSLTIVRLDTGEIVRTFRQSKTEITNTQLKDRVVEVNIDSPITGHPVAFPAETGAVADRVYVGDQDGRLWKVNLASVDPDLWKMDLFFDTFPKTRVGDASFTHGFADGRPIMLAPIVSVDGNGDITLNVATGDQDTVGTQATEKNYVWSLTEKTSNDRDSVTTKVNWFQPFQNGERVVGAMALFNSQLFFTSYAPPASTAVCSMGLTKLWGMDYVRPMNPSNSSSPPINQGGVPQLDPPTSGARVQWLSGAAVAGVSNAAVFGVSIAQTPSCTVTANEDPSDYFGYGAEQRITHVTPGKFELVMHLSGVSKTAQGDDLKASVKTLQLSPPANSTRIDSWAALVE
jgi:type IV pilus assembly protein PilY1